MSGGKRTPEQRREHERRRYARTPAGFGKGCCKRCGGLPHRVIASDGPNCRKCGLAWAAEAPVTLDTDSRRPP